MSRFRPSTEVPPVPNDARRQEQAGTGRHKGITGARVLTHKRSDQHKTSWPGAIDAYGVTGAKLASNINTCMKAQRTPFLLPHGALYVCNCALMQLMALLPSTSSQLALFADSAASGAAGRETHKNKGKKIATHTREDAQTPKMSTRCVFPDVAGTHHHQQPKRGPQICKKEAVHGDREELPLLAAPTPCKRRRKHPSANRSAARAFFLRTCFTGLPCRR